MAISDVMATITAEGKEKKEPTRKTVAFELDEWKAMEAKHGKAIEPIHIKTLVLKIFAGELTVSKTK